MLEITEDNKIIVPKGIRYISEWRDYSLSDFNFPHILNKRIPGCGFTEYCITSNLNVILCSPRKILLENKQEQHPDTVFYFKNELDNVVEVDKDITKDSKIEDVTVVNNEELKEQKREQQRKLQEMEQNLNSYIDRCIFLDVPAKILVTYDSFRLVKQYLINKNVFDTFYIVIDEMQSVFSDALFKSDTELTFVYQLQDIQKVCYVSATPMLEGYLLQLDEFKNLPYFELDWVAKDPLRIVEADLKSRSTQSIIGTAARIINTYKRGEFKELDVAIDGEIKTVQSKEAVIYVNSVKNICDIIKATQLLPEQCNILCAKTSKNQSRIKKRLGSGFEIGKVPLKGQPHKMFTFCTRTVYLGADFYSTCARSFVFSDANIKTLVVDIRLDLPQILGRQRLKENPWKNSAEFYYKTLSPGKVMTKEEFAETIRKKIKRTDDILNSYSDTREDARHSVAESYLYLAKTANYKYDYVAVNMHNGKDLVPVFNNIVWVAEQRAFEIQQLDYRTYASVINSLMDSSLGDGSSNDENINIFLAGFDNLSGFYAKMKAVCEAPLTDLERCYVLAKLPLEYKTYYEILGSEKLKSLGYNITLVRKELDNMKIDRGGTIDSAILSSFNVGERYSKADIKETLKNIYQSANYSKTPKATDLENYFEVKRCAFVVDGKRIEGFEIIKKK